MKRYFCTYFNDNYLIYGLTMFRSLKKTGIDFKLFVLCLDESVYEKLIGFDPLLEPVRLSELEAFDPETAACKTNRSMVEYFFTLSPALPLFLMHRNPEIDILAYVDSDFMFFSSPEPVWEELGEKSILIYEHDFSAHEEGIEHHGRFNVGFQLYRNNPAGTQVLQWWRGKCIEWCYDREESGRFADQKYLDWWPELFTDDVVIAEKTKPQGLAPWNMKKHAFSFVAGHLYSDGKPVIYFHFQNCKLLPPHLLWAPLWGEQSIPWRYENYFYHSYWQALTDNLKIMDFSKDLLGGRSTVDHNLFDRSKKLRKLPSWLCYVGNLFFGIWRYRDIRPYGFRLFIAREYKT